MRKLQLSELNAVNGGHCSNGLVDGSSLANVGCISQSDFDLLESQLFNIDQEPPAFVEDFGSIPFGFGVSPDKISNPPIRPFTQFP